MRAGEFTEVSLQKNPEPMLAASDIIVDSHENPQLLTIHLRQSKTDPFGVGAPATESCWLCLHTSSWHRPTLSLPGRHAIVLSTLGSSCAGALAKVGVDTTRYSGHSFRIGAATAAA